jgi:hypothetical protein
LLVVAVVVVVHSIIVHVAQVLVLVHLEQHQDLQSLLE